MNLSKKAQLAYREKRKKPTVKISEDALQKQCNDNLNGYGKRMRWIRIADYVWRTMVKEIKPRYPEVWYELTRRFAGMPDNIAITPIGEKYNLCMAIELKTEGGGFSDKQEHWRDDINVIESRSTETTDNEIRDFMASAKSINKAIEEKGIEL